MDDNLEMEIKAWCDDPEALRARIEAAGAARGETLNEKDIYFNHPSRDFKETDEALRIRSTGSDIILTYKGPKLSPVVKTRVEQEVGVDSFEQLKKILLSLGFKEAGIVQKQRVMFRLKDTNICLDAVEGVGNFVELEKLGTEKEKIEAGLLEFAEELKIKYFERRSYLELVLGNAKPPF